MTTRRDFLRRGGWAAAAAVGPVHAQERSGVAIPSFLLPPAVLRTLMACAEAVTGVASLRGHYEAYWLHHAQNSPGRADLYLRFANAVAEASSAARVADFAAAAMSERITVLQGLRASPSFEREFEVPVLQEILAVFERTDVWLQLGYDTWPGSARGLADHLHPPR